MGVGLTGMDGALAVKTVEMEPNLDLGAVPHLLRSMEGDLAQVHGSKANRASKNIVRVSMGSVDRVTHKHI